MSYAQPYFLWDRPGFCFLFSFLLRYRCSRFLTVKSTYLALLQRLLNLIIYSGREEACYPKSAAIILDTVRLMRLEAQKLINLRRYNIFFLSYLPDERMTNDQIQSSKVTVIGEYNKEQRGQFERNLLVIHMERNSANWYFFGGLKSI